MPFRSLLRQFDKANEFLNKALAIHRERRDVFMEGHTLRFLGLNYYKAKRFEESIEYFDQGVLTMRLVMDQRGEARMLIDAAASYRRLGKYDRALDALQKAQKIHTNVTDRAIQPYLHNILGNVYLGLTEFDKAIISFTRASESVREMNAERDEEGLAYWGMMRSFASKAAPLQAIIYGKQSVNVFQVIRNESLRLKPDLKQGLVSFVEGAYRELAVLLIEQGRFLEAQAVLDLLKGDEYKQLARSGENAETIPYSKAEADVITKIENLVALERARTELQKLKVLSKEQEATLEQLRLDIVAANNAFNVALDALGKAETSASTRVDEIKDSQELQSALTDLGKGTKSGVVALYTVLGIEDGKPASQNPAGINDRQGARGSIKTKFGWVIMVTDKGYKAYPIDVSNLNDLVFQFRDALTSERYDPKPLAAKIYTAIFRQTSAKQKRTLEEDLRDYLKSHKDKTLMWSLDGVLRYIPMSALHDGNRYLVETYRNVVFTQKSFLWLTRENQPNWTALGLGVSEKRETFDELPGVRTELETIVREPDRPTGIMNGSIKLNDNFKKQMFFNTVGSGSFPVVHIASHYSFNPAQQDQSFLLVGDGRLSFSELKENKNLFGTVDLLTLSACDTGVSGNGKEAEGFAYLAQSLGAKSVIASLWKVSDAGTPELMIRFYKLKAANPRLSKGEAFRQAQLSLLGAESKDATMNSPASRSEKVSVGKKTELPLFVKDDKKPFAHPHYWSSFVLIGNWR